MNAAAAALVALLPLSAAAAETVLGAYVFHRHGDRTSKSTPPTDLTDLGYQQVFQSGDYYRSRYVAAGAPLQIHGISEDVIRASQLNVSAPADAVLFTSATGFMQGLYPPANVSAERLANGSTVAAPLGGYQLAVISQVSSGSNEESNGWLQDATGCDNAVSSSNGYFYSPEYMELLDSTRSFYQTIDPVVNRTFNSSYVSYKNAYTVYDLINVAEIHNSTIQSAEVLTPEVLLQLRTLADQHEWNLAYNASSPARAIAGAQLAAQALQFLNRTVTTRGAQKLGVQFGAYATFFSFFGLARLADVDAPKFRGIPDYASSMAFELYTNASVPAGTFPDTTDDLYVRWLYNNGSSDADGWALTPYPLFGAGSVDVRWPDFVAGMSGFAVGTTRQWCDVCGNTRGQCSAEALSSAGGSSSSSSSSSAAEGAGSSSGGISNAVAGVIGAMVTLGVILLVQAAVVLAGGFRLVRKNRLPGGGSSSSNLAKGDGAAAKAAGQA